MVSLKKASNTRSNENEMFGVVSVFVEVLKFDIPGAGYARYIQAILALVGERTLMRDKLISFFQQLGPQFYDTYFQDGSLRPELLPEHQK